MATLRLTRFKLVPGRYYGTPKEIWGFRTPARRDTPRRIARAFLTANTGLLGLQGLRLRRTRIIESLGACHLIYQQRLNRVPIHRAYVTVHLARGRVYLVKNRAVPRAMARPAAAFTVTEVAIRRQVLKNLAKKHPLVDIVEVTRRWFPLKGSLRPSFRVYVRCWKPRADWIIFVDGETRRILRKYDNLAEAIGVADVFDPNPVIALGTSNALLIRGRRRSPPRAAYTRVILRDLDERGPRGGRSGTLDGRRVTTNLTRNRVDQKSRRFVFASSHRGFEEVMAYFHINRVIRYLESLGFRGPRAIFRTPVAVDANGTQVDNSWYSPFERSLTFGLGGVDDAEDADIILHELGHAIQDAICPGFGQSPEAAAMGEGFGDYLAASFFAAQKPARYRTSVGTWDAVKDTSHDPPCLRRVDGPTTYEAFDRSDDADVHANGAIWSAVLWRIWRALGRDIADRLILESHFQLDAFTTLARGARAILDADRNLYKSRHVSLLRRIFRDAGIGPVG